MRKRLAPLTAIVVLACSIFTSNSAMTTFSKSKQITTTSNELVSDENDVEVSNANNAEVGNVSASVEGTGLDKSAANNVYLACQENLVVSTMCQLSKKLYKYLKNWGALRKEGAPSGFLS